MKYLKITLFMMALLAASSCAKNTVEDKGQVSFSISSDIEIADQTKSSVSDYTTLPSAEGFAILITDQQNKTLWSGNISEWDATTDIKAGTYTVTATYGSIEEEGFDKPYFKGTATFTVQPETSIEVPINVALANTVIRISCTENFKKYYNDYTFTLTRNANTIATFVKDETKAAFIDAYKISLSGTITSATKTQSFTRDYTNLNEATAYTILFDAANVGGSSITITFNNTVETVSLGDFELNN